jgi:hypothetical protein
MPENKLEKMSGANMYLKPKCACPFFAANHQETGKTCGAIAATV